MSNLKLEIDGHQPSVEELRDAALSSYGHFTAMQVRGGRTRGLALHIARLDAANRELFGAGLDGDYIRRLIRHALDGWDAGDGRDAGDGGGREGGGAGDASLRVVVREPGSDGGAARVFVVVRPPYEMPDATQRLKSVPYVRTVPHIKRAGDFGQSYHIDRAAEAGYDDALLVEADGTVAEAGIANIAFFDGGSVVWPDATVLAGITMQLIAPRLADHGMPSRTARVALTDVERFSGACVTNSRGIAAVDRIDDTPVPVAPAFVKALRDAYASVPWDAI
ncbi:MAG TPA: aminotransferase class IV [Actinospica sp.]|nr:aminotransferase class IV [Actinospica sp.]